MHQDTFLRHLHVAAGRTVAFTRTLCWNKISDSIDFVIRPDNLTDDEPYLSAVEQMRFQVRKQELGHHYTAAEVVERLWVDEQIPAYVNISVHQVISGKTTLELVIDRRLRQHAPDIYHEQEGYPPFHVLVSMPPYAQHDKLFHTNWQKWPWNIWLNLYRVWGRFRYRLIKK